LAADERVTAPRLMMAHSERILERTGGSQNGLGFVNCFCLIAAIATVASAAAFQNSGNPGRTPTFGSTTQLVNVNVIVLDNLITRGPEGVYARPSARFGFGWDTEVS
jgi:hypothetical protein